MDRRKIAGIEQLRGLAALAVVVCHTVGQFCGIDRYAPGPEKLLGWAGQVGVAVFFVVSGFCIRLPLARARAADPGARLEVRDYLNHRFLRIIPPYWLALALSIAIGQVAGSGLLDGAHGPANVLVHVLGLHALFPSTFTSINGVFWSIGLELEFYLAYLLVADRRATLRSALGFLILAVLTYGAASVLFPRPDPWRLVGQQFVLATFWQWYLGVVLADAYVRAGPLFTSAGRMWSARLAAVALCFVLGLADPVVAGVHLTYWALPLAAAAVTASFLLEPIRDRGPGPAGEASSFTGRISYSLYLMHPIAIAVAALAVKEGLIPPSWTAAGVAMVASVLAAWVSYRLVELPLLARKRRLTRTVEPAALQPGE